MKKNGKYEEKGKANTNQERFHMAEREEEREGADEEGIKRANDLMMMMLMMRKREMEE